MFKIRINGNVGNNFVGVKRDDEGILCDVAAFHSEPTGWIFRFNREQALQIAAEFLRKKLIAAQFGDDWDSLKLEILPV